MNLWLISYARVVPELIGRNPVNVIVGWCDEFYFLLSLVYFHKARVSGFRTMEIGPIRNQNLIFWSLANVL